MKRSQPPGPGPAYQETVFRLISSLPLPLSALVCPLVVVACATPQPHLVATQYSSENSSRVISREPAAMDDAEARELTPRVTRTSIPVKKKREVSPESTIIEETVVTSTTETLIGTHPVAVPDTEIISQ